MAVLIIGLGIYFFYIMVLIWKRINKKAERKAENKLIQSKNEFEAYKQKQISEIDEYRTRQLSEIQKYKEKELKEIDQYQSDAESILSILVTEKSKGFPYLAEAYSEYIDLKYSKIANYLRFKPKPALKASEVVNDLKKETKDIIRENKILSYTIKYYENLYPNLQIYNDINDNELDYLINKSEEKFDPVRYWLSEDEYNNLLPIEKNQLALNRYITRNKSKYQIGIEYERYIGYLYEIDGYKVEYHGAINGLNDLGIDLICKKDCITVIIQCKKWSKEKVIHEKHINQLYGTSIYYYISNDLYKNNKTLNELNIYSYLYTTTELSDTAKTFAKVLNIQYKEYFHMKEYPLIKCNISKNGEKIYHLPFDQQYDRVRIENKGECYLYTVKEAEERGFRRAKKWVPK